MSQTERAYLFCYDYGMSGLWWWITASSPEDITSTYSNVLVFKEPPDWWTDDDDRLTPRLRLGEVAPGLTKI
jgi:hypothetical protein